VVQLEVNDLAVQYGEIKALKGISFKVDQGDFVTLIGANGAGKTTLLNALTGVVKSTRGEIIFNGREISGMRSDNIVRMKIAHVPEGRKIFSELTAEDNLFAGAYIISDKEQVKKNLKHVYSLFPLLEERRLQIGGTLSGGEQQMLAIGRGLMSNPDILFLDEPSLGLAPIIIETIFDYIKEINKEGKTIFLVEQNANMALQFANYGYVLETGNIIIEDKSEDLINNDVVRKAYLGGL
jgi:branched-chain amino acid transport system ATP-binding protein